MARATKRPKTGVYQIRKRIPADVRAIVGGPAVFKQSLGTKDAERAAAEFRRIEAIGGEVYRDLIERTGKNRGMWVHHSFAWFLYRCEKLDEVIGSSVMADWWPELEPLHGANLDKILDRRGMIVTSRTRDMLLLAAHRAGRQIAAVIVRQVNGDYTPDPGAGRFPEMPSTRSSDGKGEFEAVWSAWIKDAKPSQNTLKRWRPVVDRMIAFAGESNLGRISEATLNDWIASLLEELGNNTIARVRLAATKRLFRFALTKKLISRDPTTGLKVESGKKYELKMRGYRDYEALMMILKACLDRPSDRLTAEHRAARRWVPWICAYTGARVNEITQLRACDVWTMAGRLFIDITPEAGTAKTGARTVPLHEHCTPIHPAAVHEVSRGRASLAVAERGASARRAACRHRPRPPEMVWGPLRLPRRSAVLVAPATSRCLVGAS